MAALAKYLDDLLLWNPAILDQEADRGYGIGRVDRPVRALVRLDQYRQHVQPIAVRRPRTRIHQPFDLAECRFVIRS